jgi:hypothetical protein
MPEFYMSISKQLCEVIRASGKSAYQSAKETGLPGPTITRFLGRAAMKVSTIYRLAANFGLVLTKGDIPDDPAKRKAKK